VPAPKPEPPVVVFASRADWAAWLSEHHGEAAGVWLRLERKGGDPAPLTQPEALEVAIAHGWIDGTRKRLDERHYLQRFTPRRPRSKWSKVNREKALELIARGEMAPPGLAEVDRAKADGRWDAAYSGQRTMKVPADLQAELDRNPAAAEFFTTLDSRNRYAVLYRIDDAKRPETRARRIAKFVEMLNAGETVHPRPTRAARAKGRSGRTPGA
jgi:uncharacterized protein YdeI (YjbR/CyaY-like superfamily)